ncbi:MAG TPA: S8 family serine peptidase, partial [Thermoanaerobaculia bacterium]
MKRLAVILVLVLFAAAALAGPKEVRKSANRIPDQYIVVLNDDVADVDAAASDLAQLHRGQKDHVFKHAVKGFSVRLSEPRALQLAEDPRVAFVEEDAVVTLTATQTGATWGLDRIDQRDLPLNSSYTYNYTGSGVRA